MSKHKVVLYLYRYKGKEWLSVLESEYIKPPPTPKCDKCGSLMYSGYSMYMCQIFPVSSIEVDVDMEDDGLLSRVQSIS